LLVVAAFGRYCYVFTVVKITIEYHFRSSGKPLSHILISVTM